MLQKTPAIVLAAVKYGDNSLVLKTYTREEGLMAFIGSGIRSRKGVLRPALVQPLSQLQIIYYAKGRGELKRIKEASVEVPYQQIFFDPVKSSLAMFLAEVLSHLLHEDEANPGLYDFISGELTNLDSADEGLGNFHLLFLYKLMDHLGFAPENPGSHPVFDLMNGVYLKESPPHPHFLNEQETFSWKNLHQASGKNEMKMSIGRNERADLLTALLTYYRLHVKDFGTLRSLSILKELLS